MESSSPVNIQDSEPESEEPGNSEPEREEEPEQGEGCHLESSIGEEANSEQEPKEEDRQDSEQERARHFDDELENEVGPPQIPTMSPQNDLLQDFETGMAQALANLNAYMQPGGSLDPNLMEAQSPGDSSHTKILPSPKATDQEEEANTEVIHESDNQSGDTVLLEHSHDKQ